MPIEFRCSQCQKLLRTGDETAGKKAKCPECGTVMEIPQSSTAHPPAPSAGAVPGAEPPSPFGSPPGGAQGVSPDSPFQSGPPPGGPAPPGVPPFGTPPGRPANPYQSPSGFVPGPSPSLTPQGPVQPTRIDVGDVMTRAWEIFKDRMGICIGAALIVGVFSLAPVLGIYMVMCAGLIQEPVLCMFVLATFALPGWLFFIWLVIGQTVLFLKVARGQPAAIADLFTGGPFYLPALLAAILFVSAFLAGCLLCYVPGIIVALMFSQFMYLIVDKRLDAIESLSVSNQITTGNKVTLFLLSLVLSLIASGVGIFTCNIGLIFVIPFMQVVWVVAYLTMTGQPTAEQVKMQQMQMPPGPQRMM